MNTKRYCGMIITMIFIFECPALGQEAKSFLSLQDILSTWQNNYGELKSMKVSYTEELISAEPPPNDPNATKRMAKWVYVERIEEGKKFRGKSSTSMVKPAKVEDSFSDINNVDEMTFDGIQQRRYFASQKAGQIFVNPMLQNAATVNRLKRYLMSEPYLEWTGSEIRETKESIFSRSIKTALSDPNQIISVRPDLEEVAGQICHVVESYRKDTPKEKVATIIWVAYEKGMLPIKYQRIGSEGIVHEITVEQIDYAGTGNGGLWFPKKAYEMDKSPSLGIIKTELNVLEFVPNIKVEPNTFKLDFPNGTQVYDSELGIGYTVGVK